MPITRRTVAAGLSLLAVSLVQTGTAAAQAADHRGTATAEALTIVLFGQTITTSASTAELTPVLAKASATQVLTPLQQPPALTAETSTVGESKTEAPSACPGSQLTAVPSLRRVDITCGSATANLLAAGGSARGLGAEVVLELSISELLAALELQSPAQQGTNQLVDSLNPLFEGLTGTPLAPVVDGTTETVADVLDGLLTLQSTVRIVVAPALAETQVGDRVTARARAQGVRIELLPADGAGSTNNLLPDDLAAGEPLITITIGQAETTASVDRDGGGAAKADADAALVTVTFGSVALTRALGLPSDTVEVGEGRSFCIPGLEGTPLETCVTVADAGVAADGTPFANGTRVQLLKGVNGGIDLATGRASSGGFRAAAAPGAPAVAVAAPAAPAGTAGGELPRTGGPAMLPLAGAALLALAAAAGRLARR